MAGARVPRDVEHGPDLRVAVEASEAGQTPSRGSGVRTLIGISMPGTFAEKLIPHGLGAVPRGWLVTSIRVQGASAEYPAEVRRTRQHLVLTTVTPETIDLLVW